MVAKGVLGAIVDGVIRDAETLSRQGLSVFARGTTPPGPSRTDPASSGTPSRSVGSSSQPVTSSSAMPTASPSSRPPMQRPPRKGSTRSLPKKKRSGSASSRPSPADPDSPSRKDSPAMADNRRLPGPQLTQWDWQLAAACRGMASTTFFHPPDERGPARENRIHDGKKVCRACPSR
jgi:hypothetical protein